MNIFDKLANAGLAQYFQSRLNTLARVNPKGFRSFAKTPRVHANGKTRGEMKREARLVTNEKVSEFRAPEFAKYEVFQ